MKKVPVIIDLETKFKFREVPSRKKLGVSLVGAHDYRTQKTEAFSEKEFQRLFTILEGASYIVGFNIRSFDIPLLQQYYPGDFSRFLIFDILDYVKEKIGRRLSLNDILFATLGKKKTGHGLIAIDLYKEGKLEELKEYCLNDVMLTRELFEYGVKNGKINYLNTTGKAEIEVDWKKYFLSPKNHDTHLTLPF